ncbi:MAG: methyl-accepting chemotaxis protein [Pseudomonadota bacterium]
MDTDAALSQLRTHAEEAERHTMTAPMRLFDLLLETNLRTVELGAEGGTACPQRARRIATNVEGLEASAAYLKDNLASDFKVLGVEIPKDVATAANAIRAELRAALDALNGGDVGFKALDEVAIRARKSLQNQVDAFLGALFTFVVEAERERGRRGKDLDSEAVNEIGDIASRISLIAVNASIEAARVGEAGLGFAVIANEIQELSKKSEETVKNIRDNIV